MRKLIAAHVDTDATGSTPTFTFGELIVLPQPVEGFTYVVDLSGNEGAMAKHFGALLSPTKTKAFVFEFESATPSQLRRVPRRGPRYGVPDSELTT